MQLQGSLACVSLTVDTDMNNIYRLYINSTKAVEIKWKKVLHYMHEKKAHTKTTRRNEKPINNHTERYRNSATTTTK